MAEITKPETVLCYGDSLTLGFDPSSNDLMPRFGLNADAIARCLGRLLDVVAKSGCGPGGVVPRILVMIPPVIGDLKGPLVATLFNEGSRAESRRLQQTYPPIAAAFGAHCFDTNEVVAPGTIDGVHCDPDQLQPLAAPCRNHYSQLVVTSASGRLGQRHAGVA